MRNSLFRLLVAALLSSVMFGSLFARAEEPKDEKGKKAGQLEKTTGSPIFQPLNCNNVLSWFGSNGNGSFPPSKTGDGVYYPRGTGSAMYEDGLMWGAKVYQDAAKTKPGGLGQPVRIGGNEYNMGNQAGWIVGNGASAVAADQNLPSVRIYRIRRDWNSMTDDEYKRDAGESNEISPSSATNDQIAAIRAQYAKDWDEWPVTLGAPFVERNGVPGYQKPPRFNYDETAGKLFTADSLVSGKFDEPGVAGADVNLPADQVLWTAYNDLNRSLTTALYGSEPLGVECQVTLWGYKRTDAMGNCYFRRYRLINKGGAVIDDSNNKGTFFIDSMYVCQWSDPDLGEAGDDIVGCDTTTSLGFVYNGVPVDPEYAGFKLPPPASGWDFMAGAVIPGKPTDSAVYNFKRIYGKKNLGMTGFAYFSAGSALSDPRPRTYSIGGQRWWKMLRGYAPMDGPDVFYPFPPGLTPGPFPLSGDPVTGKGFVDGLGQAYAMSPGDRRLLLNSGPFALAPGDTNEIVVALVVGMGADRLSSVSVLKFNDQFAQNTFDALFVVPVVPSPNVNVAQLDRTIVLDWGWDPQTIDKSENKVTNPGAFVFEGYNVYQLPSLGADLSQGKRLATYDLINSYSVLLDLTFDQASGLIITKPVQYGSNDGVQHTYTFTADALADKPALNNGQDYFLAVTSYFRATTPGFLPQVLESSPARARVTPQGPVPGTKYNAKVADPILATHSAGTAEGSVSLSVVDPTRITDNSYKVTFTGTATSKTFSVLNVTTGKTLFFGGKNLGTDWGGTALDYPTADGVMIKVNDAAGVSPTVFWSGGTRWIDGADLFDGDPYGGVNYGVIPGSQAGAWLGAYAPSFPLTSIYSVELRFNTAVTQKAYRVLRDANRTNNNYVIGVGFALHQRILNGTITSSNRDTVIGTGTSFLADFAAGGADGITSPVVAPGATIRVDTSVAGTKNYRNFTVSFVLSNTKLRVSAIPNHAVVSQPVIRVGDEPMAPLDTLPAMDVPFTVWDVSKTPARQLTVSVRDNNRNGIWDGTSAEYLNIYDMPYDPTMSQYGTTKAQYQTANIATGGPLAPIMYICSFATVPGQTLSGSVGTLTIAPRLRFTSSDVYTFSPGTMAAIKNNTDLAKAQVDKINVFPNPYYALNPQETNRFVRFVTFNHLPPNCTVRIFNLAGHLVRSLIKDGAANPTQFMQWDLNNQYGFPVASGIYIAYIDMPDLGKTKVLKVAVIQEQEVLTTY
jgi:hypothetical protein